MFESKRKIRQYRDMFRLEVFDLRKEVVKLRKQIQAYEELKDQKSIISDKDSFCYSSECRDCRFYEETRSDSSIGIRSVYRRCKLKNPVCKHFELAPHDIEER